MHPPVIWFELGMECGGIVWGISNEGRATGINRSRWLAQMIHQKCVGQRYRRG